jgi:hypothetical protein
MKLPNLSKTIHDKLEYQDTPKQYNKTIHISIFLICNLAISGILGQACANQGNVPLPSLVVKSIQSMLGLEVSRGNKSS